MASEIFTHPDVDLRAQGAWALARDPSWNELQQWLRQGDQPLLIVLENAEAVELQSAVNDSRWSSALSVHVAFQQTPEHVPFVPYCLIRYHDSIHVFMRREL